MLRFTVEEIAGLLNGVVEGDSKRELTHPAKIEEATAGGLCFLSNPKYEAFIYTTQASAVLVKHDFKPTAEFQATLIRVEDPYLSFTRLLERFQALLSTDDLDGDAPYYVHPSAQIGEHVKIGAFVHIGPNVKIGDYARIYPHVSIQADASVGKNTILYSNVSIYKSSVIGDRCIIHANTVIGSDGFGFAPQADGTYAKIPQIGNVIIENDVEIGANSTIDRATMGSTRIREGVKIDNLVQIAHNVEIGKHTVIAAQTGVSGSTKIGENCIIGGQVGIVGHIQIANGTKINAQSGVAKTIKAEGTSISGSPATDLKKFYKAMSVVYSLPEKIYDIDKLIREYHAKTEK